MKIRFLIGQTSVTATLDDSGSSRDVASLLPLELELNDLFRREKSGQLPRGMREEGRRTYTYEVGDIVSGLRARTWRCSTAKTVARCRNWDDPPRIDDSGVDAFAGSSSVRALISGSAEGD